MVEAQKEILKELFRDFLMYLDEFLQENDLTRSQKIFVAYVQEPVENFEGLYARGVVQVWGEYYPFEAKFDKDLKTVMLDSDVFYFHLRVEEVEEFLRNLGVVVIDERD